jgi:cytochrome c biogenesis protein CcmG, thiol:disulfide interchange protein DsbE
MRRALAALAAVILVAVVVIGLTQASGGSDAEKQPAFDLPAAKRQLAAAPAPLNGLYAQANELLDGGESAFGQRLGELKGHPLVINKWASWCVPCQTEFPIFQTVATRRGKGVGFLGLNVSDVNAAARKFLAKRPLPYPSYVDAKEELTHSLKAPLKIAPVTVFVDRAGKTAYIHPGEYKTSAQLSADIDRYLR